MNYEILAYAAAASALTTAAALAWAVYRSPAHQRRLMLDLNQGVKARKGVMTPNEAEFFNRLRRALPEHTVLAQVPLSSLISTTVPETDPDFWASFDRFSRKVADFVVLERKSTRPLVVVELDDRTHDHKRDKDRARDVLLRAAGIRTVRWDSRAKPSEQAIRSQLQALLPEAFR